MKTVLPFRYTKAAIEMGELLSHRRMELGLSQYQVCKATGIDHTQLTRLERGLIKKPSFADTITLAHYYSIPLTALEAVIIENQERQKLPPLPKREALSTLVRTLLEVGDEELLTYSIVLLQALLKYYQYTTPEEGM